ncbi:LrgB family protein [Psychrobacillus vulpis]|uniref:LrgB family protein n=1 Tax=Psychrobacillus vulpis TaxID=2325572 RepID=A0A544TRW3_9BACI|nr:LrgB family protein [Psychrobacillus vulpis]TQR20140.1 LrgB family protein [Psychrobacillus vulpis]
MLAISMIVGTVLIYYLMTKLNARFSTPLLFPVLTTTILIVLLLTSFSISYDTYMDGAKWIDAMLGPAVVSLAYPLYTQRGIIKKYKFSIISSVVVAMFTGIVSIVILAKLLNIDDEIVRSLLSKSITTPVAMQISESIGGFPALTAVFVIVAGLTGVLVGPLVFKLCRIEKSVSRGISMGSASHGFGISKLSEYGEQALSMGSVSMTLSAVIGAFICPLFALFFI